MWLEARNVFQRLENILAALIMKVSTAYNYRNAAKLCKVCATVAQTFDANAMYLLGADGAPDKAVKQSIALALLNLLLTIPHTH